MVQQRPEGTERNHFLLPRRQKNGCWQREKRKHVRGYAELQDTVQ